MSAPSRHRVAASLPAAVRAGVPALVLLAAACAGPSGSRPGPEAGGGAEAAAPAPSEAPSEDALAQPVAPPPPATEPGAPELPPPPPEDPLGDADWLEEDWLDEGPTPAQRDPWEPVNRPVHAFNESVHQWVLDPVADAYELAVPEAGRRAVYRFFENLSEPVTFVNHVLQLAPCDAGATGARFLVNSTVGLAGLFDPAGRFGIEPRPTDFGQTLAVYRVGSGPYLVVPVLGPSTVRDAVGGLVDAALRPDVWLLGGWGQLMTLQAGRGLAIYDVEHERIDALRESSIDFYSALRAAYLMNRDARVEARIERVRGGATDDRTRVAGPGASPEAPSDDGDALAPGAGGCGGTAPSVAP